MEMPDFEFVNVILIMTVVCVSSSWVLNCVTMQMSRNILSRQQIMGWSNLNVLADYYEDVMCLSHGANARL